MVAVEDPYDLTRLDAIKAMNLAPRHDFVVAPAGSDIIDYINASYGVTTPVGARRRTSAASSSSSASARRTRSSEEDADAAPEVDETDSGIVKLCQPDHHRRLQPRRLRHPRRALRQARAHRRSGCASTATATKYLEIPPAHRNAVVQRFKIMSKLDISEKRKPQDGKIRFKGPMGTIELRVATIPTSGGNEDVVMRILAASQAAAPREDGLLRPQPHRVQEDPGEAVRHLPGGGPDGLRQDHDAALRPRLHQHRGHEDLDGGGPGRDHAGRACARCRCTRRSTSRSRWPCARSCAPTPT